MAQRGRKSAAALAIVTRLTDHRPPPPEGLTKAEAEEWRAIVGRLPSSWFPRECHCLLEAFVKHASSFRLLSASIDAFDPIWLARDDGLARYGQLLAMREREGRAMSSLATRLRITPASRYHPTTAARAAADAGGGGVKPWERHA
jgi:hypothetical protein